MHTSLEVMKDLEIGMERKLVAIKYKRDYKEMQRYLEITIRLLMLEKKITRKLFAEK